MDTFTWNGKTIKETKMIGYGSYGKIIQADIDRKACAIKYAVADDLEGIFGIRDIDMLRRIRHPNAICSDMIINKQGTIGSAMPLADTDLHTYMEKNNPSMEVRERLACQLLSIMHFFHSNGLLHSDVKPENFLIKDGSLIICDYGTTHSKDFQIWNSCTYTMADPYKLTDYFDCYYKEYALPEILKDRYATPTTNYQQELWAIGGTLYYIFSGKYIIGYPTRGKKNIPWRQQMFNFFIERMNRFLLEKDKMISTDIPEKWAPIISKFFQPQPNFTLEDIPYTVYSLGSVSNPKRPTTINPSIKDVLTFIKTLNNRMEHSRKIAYLAMDMAFRVPEIKDEMMVTVYFIAMKFYETPDLDTDVFWDEIYDEYKQKEVLKNEPEIILALDGMIGNELPYDYLPSELYDEGLDWIIAHPEEYIRLSAREIAAAIEKLD